jgi:hypothetical protein
MITVGIENPLLNDLEPNCLGDRLLEGAAFQLLPRRAQIGMDSADRITVTVHLIHGPALAPVDDNQGKTGNALHACERATRQMSALSP